MQQVWRNMTVAIVALAFGGVSVLAQTTGTTTQTQQKQKGTKTGTTKTTQDQQHSKMGVGQKGKHVTYNTQDFTWGPPPSGLPEGAQAMIVNGDPTKKELFTVRIKFPANYTIAPHYHPVDENVTVISGDLNVGLGNTLDKTNGMVINEDGFTVMPAKQNHFAWTTGETVIQVHAMGPWAITYVNPSDDPRKTKARVNQNNEMNDNKNDSEDDQQEND